MIRRLSFLILLFTTLSAKCQDAPIILGQPDAVVYDIEFIPEKKYLIATLGNVVQIWNHESKAQVNSWATADIIALDFNGNQLAGVSRSGNLVIWDINNGSGITTKTKLSH